jgi:GT2 family glycosyltransferase
MTCDLSLLVTTRNSHDRLSRFLPGLVSSVQALEVASEVIVVDDGSDPAVHPVESVPVAGVRWLRHRQRFGAAAGRNTAAAAARGDWLLFCDDDVDFPADALRRLWEARDRNHCLVPEARGPEGELQNSVALSWRLFDPKFVFYDVPVSSVAFPVGICFLLRRDVFWAAGGFDERITPNYFEDTAFGIALRRRGATVRMVEGSVAVHHGHSGDFAARLARIRPALYENRWIFSAVALDGRRRAVVLALGGPRVLVESTRRRNVGPLVGYLRALRRLPSLRSREPLVKPAAEKLVPGWDEASPAL